MKFTFTMLLSVLTMLSLNAQVIWGGPGDPNGEFDGGLNDWTTVGLSSAVADSAANAVWEWDADAIPNKGAYGGNNTILESPSAANGAAYFDSDFYDNAGVPDAFGSGIAPSPQTSELISPLIDLSGEQNVVLTFYQKFRNFDAQTIVNVSGDGGETFTSFPINTDIGGNTTSTATFQTINISSVAGGSDSVVVKFTWSGNYYYWIIDDVAITKLPANDLALADNNSSPFYSPHSAAQPLCAAQNDPLVFAADISNAGSDTIFDMTYKIEVYLDDLDSLVYTDSIVIPVWEPGITDSTVVIAESWTPTDVVEGLYRIEHTTFNPSDLNDFNITDNVATQTFLISEAVFSKELTGRGAFGTYENGGFYAVGAFYQFGPDCLENYTISSIDYAVGQSSSDPNSIVGRPVEIWLWKLNTTLDNFDTSTNYEEDIQTISHPSMDFVAFSVDALDEDDVNASIVVHDEPFLNVDADEVTPIFEPGATYGLFAHWGTQGSVAPLHLFTSDFNSSTDLFYSDGWFGGFQDSKSAPILRLRLELFSSVDDQPLADKAFKLYPNPTSNVINIDIDLESASNATVTIADITGKVISYENLSSVQSETLTINVSNYPAGTYLARIATEEGTKTTKFVVE